MRYRSDRGIIARDHKFPFWIIWLILIVVLVAGAIYALQRYGYAPILLRWLDIAQRSNSGA